MPRKLESLLLEGPAGKLEALLEEPEDTSPRAAAILCHPHPLYGGTMHNKVVHRLARGLRRAGAAVVRINFRGVGSSEGAYDHGIGETEDARAALEWMRARYAAVPYLLAGFSFGSRVVLRLGCSLVTSPQPPLRIIAAGFPTRAGALEGLEQCAAPKVFLQSTHDQYGPRAELEPVFAGMADPKRLVWIPSSDHFFAGGLELLEQAVFELGL